MTLRGFIANRGSVNSGPRLAAELDFLGLYGQVNKRTRWMPRQLEAMKDVIICEKLGGGD